jgi:DHA1 family tetracycline resistance protein-like MFS transporter
MPIQRPRAAVIFIFITVLLDMLALGMIIPVLPALIKSFVGTTERAAQIYGVFGTSWALMQFLFSPMIGTLSDRFGRRPVVLASNLGLGLDYVLMAMAPNLFWLFIGRVISGITAASVSTSFAYVADVTPPAQRARAFGLMGAAFGAGFILGPALGGLLTGFGPRMPFWVAAAMSLANALYGFLVLPESLARENRAAFRWRSANPVGALRLLRQNRGLIRFALINFLVQLASVVYPSVFVLYAGFRYGWDAKTTGLTLAGFGFCSMVVQGGLVGRVIKRFGERTTLMIGLISELVGFLLFGLADTVSLFAVAVPLSAASGLVPPPLQSMMTRLVGASEQGRLQGANTSLTGIAQLIGPSIFTLSFSAAVSSGFALPGVPFLFSALFIAAACLVSLWVVGGARTAEVMAE